MTGGLRDRLTPLNQGLLVALALLLGLEFGFPVQRSEQRTIEKLFPTLYKDLAARTLLVQGEQRIAIERDEGGRWVMLEHHDYPASPRKLAELLSALTSLMTLDLVTSDAASHSEYGLGSGALRVQVWDAAGEVLADLIQGAEISGAGASYVRRAGQDDVYRAPRLRTIDLGLQYWLDVVWMPFAEALVNDLALEGELLDSSLHFKRDDKTVDRWRTQDGRSVSAAPLKALARAAQSLFVDSVAGPASLTEQLGEPTLQLTLGLINGQTLGARFWELPEDQGALAQRVDPQQHVVRFSTQTWQMIRQASQALAELP